MFLHQDVQKVLAAAAAPDIDDEGKMLNHLLKGAIRHLVTGCIHNIFNKNVKKFQKVHHHYGSERVSASQYTNV